MHMTRRSIVHVLPSVLLVFALLCIPFSRAASAEVREYRTYLKATLNPFGAAVNDPQADENGAVYMDDAPISTLNITGEASGSAGMYQYVPEIALNDWVEGGFAFNPLEYDSYRERSTIIHELKSNTGSGVRFVVRHLDEEYWELRIEIINATGGVATRLVMDNSSQGYDMGSSYNISYLIHCTANPNPWWNTVNVYLSGGGETDDLHAQKKTGYVSYWARASYVTQPLHSNALEMQYGTAWLKAGRNEHSLTDDIIVPDDIPTGCRWILATSLDPYSGTDLQKYASNDGTVAEVSSGLRTGPWNYGMSATITGAQKTALFEQYIPGIDVGPSGLSGSLDGAVAIEGKFWVKMDDTDEPDDGDVTCLHALYAKNEDTGIRFCMKHDGNGEAKLRIEITAEVSGQITVVNSDDAASDRDWTNDWQYVHYRLTREWNAGSEHWESYDLDAWINSAPVYNNGEAVSPDCSIDAAYPATNGNLRRALYGIQADSGRDEKWYLDDSWVSAGIKDDGLE